MVKRTSPERTSTTLPPASRPRIIAAERRANVGSPSSELLRDLAALVVAAVACPAALFGGALLGCAAQGLTATCALEGILVSPILLFAAGVVAGLLSNGWVGLVFVMGGVLAGMVSIPLLASAIGNPVPIDPVQGVIATLWFLPPVVIGYGLTRGAFRLVPSRRRGGSDRS
jgi:hypothetical protein